MNFITFIFYLICFFIFYDFYKKNKRLSKSPNKEANGPWSLPIIGGLYLIGDRPNRSFTELSKKYGGIYKIWLGERMVIVITDPEIVQDIWIKQHHIFVNRPHNITSETFSLNYKSLVFGDVNEWNSVRPKMTCHFTKVKLNSLKPKQVVNDQLKKMLKIMSSHCLESKPFDQYVYLNTYSMNIIVGLMLSVEFPYSNSNDKNGQFSKVLHSIDEIFKCIGTNGPEDIFPTLLPLFKKKVTAFTHHLDVIKDFIRVIYKEQIKSFNINNEPRNIMDSLIAEYFDNNNNDDDGVDSDNGELIIQLCIDMLVGATDTSASTLGWFMLFMINNPSIQEELYEEIINVVGKDCPYVTFDDVPKLFLIKACFQEVLRIRPVTSLSLPRVAMEDTTTINDIFIPKDTIIIQNIFGMSNSEKFVSNPTVFNPHRWLNYKKIKDSNQFDCNSSATSDNSSSKYYNDLDRVSTPFGVGKRRCMAPNMAEHNILIAMANIILNFKMKSSDPQQVSLSEEEEYAITIKPKYPFKVLFEKYHK
ncbi:hypothetical protein RB653_003896 [Dictyostelium firmibasis]|uniref:Cytochrome P450 n=1 Tax=Dictyostelium firmibasis TaxID=79012 RepID=A0AAN7U8U5_9MYCE